MIDTPTEGFFAQQAALARELEQPGPRGHRRERHGGPGRGKRGWPGHGRRGPARPAARRRRRVLRWAGLTAGLLAVLTGAAVGSAYLAANQVAGSIQRIPGIVALDAAHQPVMPAATRRSMTVLLTGSATLPGSGLAMAPNARSGLIALVHNHYPVLGFAGVTRVVQAVHGVNVTVPCTVTSLGHTFPAGLNHLTGGTDLPYVRQPGVGEIGRVLLQQNLIRTIPRRYPQTVTPGAPG